MSFSDELNVVTDIFVILSFFGINRLSRWASNIVHHPVGGKAITVLLAGLALGIADSISIWITHFGFEKTERFGPFAQILTVAILGASIYDMNSLMFREVVRFARSKTRRGEVRLEGPTLPLPPAENKEDVVDLINREFPQQTDELQAEGVTEDEIYQEIRQLEDKGWIPQGSPWHDGRKYVCRLRKIR